MSIEDDHSEVMSRYEELVDTLFESVYLLRTYSWNDELYWAKDQLSR